METQSNGLPVQSLFVGSRDGRAFPDADRQAFIEATSAAFDDFTVLDTDGYSRGRNVGTIVIKLETDDIEVVISLARRLGALLAQQSIGDETGGRFHSWYRQGWPWLVASTVTTASAKGRPRRRQSEG
jgi:hypothetical protein